MEEGALRVDANVSLRRPDGPLSTRTEIKNIGSIRGVANAIRYEIERQREILESGGEIINETRAWDATNKATIAMRDKEVVQDYRYMPEPNLPPLRVNLHSKEDHQDVISVPLIQDKIPELPEESRLNLIQEYQLRPDAAIQLVNEPILLHFFRELTSDKQRNSRKVSNFLINTLLMVLNQRKLDVSDCSIAIKQLGELIDMLLEKKINLDICKMVLDELVNHSNSDKSPLAIVEERGWLMISDETEITKICAEIIENNPKMVKQYKEGKVKVLKALLGILSKNSQNKIDMNLASKIMEKVLKK